MARGNLNFKRGMRRCVTNNEHLHFYRIGEFDSLTFPTFIDI